MNTLSFITLDISLFLRPQFSLPFNSRLCYWTNQNSRTRSLLTSSDWVCLFFWRKNIKICAKLRTRAVALILLVITVSEITCNIISGDWIGRRWASNIILQHELGEIFDTVTNFAIKILSRRWWWIWSCGYSRNTGPLQNCLPPYEINTFLLLLVVKKLRLCQSRTEGGKVTMLLCNILKTNL